MAERKAAGPMSDVAERPVGRRAVLSWCLFDWANSVYPTLIITFVFAAYFTRTIAATPEEGTAQWGTAMSLSALFVAVVSPILGAIADQDGRRKPWLFVTSLVCITASAVAACRDRSICTPVPWVPPVAAGTSVVPERESRWCSAMVMADAAAREAIVYEGWAPPWVGVPRGDPDT